MDRLFLNSNVFKMNQVRNLPILYYIFIRLVFLNCIWQLLPSLGGLEFIKFSPSSAPHCLVFKVPNSAKGTLKVAWSLRPCLPVVSASSAEWLLSTVTQRKSFLCFGSLRGHQELMVSTGTLIYVALEASLLTMDFPLNEVIHTPHIHSPIHSFNECIECPPHARHMHRPCKQSR